jgi:hypothetical protein
MPTGDFGEIGAKDKGQQQRVIGLAGPIEKEPAPNAFARRNHSCHGGPRFARSSLKGRALARGIAAAAAAAQAQMNTTAATDIKFCAIDDPGCEACQ